MFRIVAFLTLLSHPRFARGNFRTCVPNTQFILNERICYCDGKGQWTDASCLYVSKTQICQPGQVVWHGCSQCVCQETGQLLCNMVNCPDDVKLVGTTSGIHSIGPWCTPFRIYYVDCNICVCPESGRTANVHCVKDISCTALRTPSMSDLLASSNKNLCKPKVLYLFSCLHCLCSDEGTFILSNCIETCPSKPRSDLSYTCIPNSVYRYDCNVCLCQSNGIHNENSCTTQLCDGKYVFKALQTLTSEIRTCSPNQFTPTRCFYCHCNPGGFVNQQACLELSCFKARSFEYNVVRHNCSPGEMVSFCTECFCLNNSTTREEYCTRGCSYRYKMDILEKIFKNSNTDQLVNLNAFDTTVTALTCKTNSIYSEAGKFCLCPDSQTREKSCIVAVQRTFNFQNPASQFAFRVTNISIDFNSSCQPSTFVNFECNSCFCSKNGTIDPKWCTYDDCEAKKIILEAQSHRKPVTEVQSENCTPGSITEVNCNFCICPESGIRKDLVCTKNSCNGLKSMITKNIFDCEPLEYYEVGCNICLCQRDGKKNVAKCTKNICEDNFLRSDDCTPGTLFSDECNICVCPSDGNKKDRVCTNYDCIQSDSAWKRIFKFSNTVLDDLPVDAANKLDLCFPGEEYSVGSYFCVCPEMGLRSYATCSKSGLNEEDDDNSHKDRKEQAEASANLTLGIGDSFTGTRNLSTNESVHNISTATNSTAKSTYIKGCQQCIKQSLDSNDEYCRPLNTTYCNSSGILDSSINKITDTNSNTNDTIETTLAAHGHTRYKCVVNGTDKCHVCECEQDGSMVREHCFSSVGDACAGKEPTFLTDKIV